MRADELSTKIASWWRWPFIAGIAILGTLGAMAASQYNEFTRASADIEHADAITRAVDDLMTVLVNAETGYRGYLLSGNPIFLEPYRGVDARARDAMVTLTGLVAGDARRRDDLSRLSGLVEERLAEMSANITRFEAGDPAGAIASVRTARGKRIMDEIRLVGGTLKSEQRAVTSNRAAQGAAAARAARRCGSWPCARMS